MIRDFSKKQKIVYYGHSKIKQVFKKLIEHPQITSVFVLLCANVFNNLITFVVNIFLAKKIGIENFGIFSLSVSIMMTVSIISDFGMSLTMQRFFNLYQNEEKQQKLLLTSLLTFRVLLILILILGSVPGGFLLSKILHLGYLYQPLISLSIISGAIFTLWTYFENFLQAYRKFSKLARYIITYAIFRLLCLILLYLIYSNVLNITMVLASLYTIPVMLITFIGLTPIAIGLFYKTRLSLNHVLKIVGAILRYSKWVVISSVAYNLILRGIPFILAIRSSKVELGIFSAGFVFTIAFSTLNMAVRAVFFPHVTSFDEIRDMKTHLSRIRKVFPYYLLFMLIAITILGVIQSLFLGNEYVRALPIFIITSVALALTIFMGLISMLLHTLMHPEIDAFVNIGLLIVVVTLVYFLTPNFGAFGGAIGYALPLILGEFFKVMYVRRTINEQS